MRGNAKERSGKRRSEGVPILRQGSACAGGGVPGRTGTCRCSAHSPNRPGPTTRPPCVPGGPTSVFTRDAQASVVRPVGRPHWPVWPPDSLTRLWTWAGLAPNQGPKSVIKRVVSNTVQGPPGCAPAGGFVWLVVGRWWRVSAPPLKAHKALQTGQCGTKTRSKVGAQPVFPKSHPRPLGAPGVL